MTADLDHLVVRRKTSADTEDVFLAAHETFTASPNLTAVDALTFESNAGSAVGMRVSLADGTVDYIIQTLDDGPTYPSYVVSGVDLEVAGRFAHVRIKDDQVVWMYLVQGSKLRFGHETLEAGGADYSQRGAVTGVERKESGAAENAFVVDTPLPGNDDRWVGKTVLVRYGNGWTWPYRIERVDGPRIVISDEPGFELDSKGVDRQYFPLQENLGLDRFEGPVTFVVAGSALRDEAGNIASTLDPPGTVDGGAGSGGGSSSGGASGVDGSAGGSVPGAGSSDDATSGCSCDLARKTRTPWTVLLLAMLTVPVLRRRRLHS